MATTPHSGLTGANLHEPKGVAAAAVDKVYISDGAGSGSFAKIGANQITAKEVNPFGAHLFRVRDEQVSGTGGPSYTLGDWRQVRLNTVATNEIINASLSSNQLLLPAGTYDFRARVPFRANGVVVGQIRLYSITDAAVIAVGQNDSASENQDNNLFLEVEKRFTISGAKTTELQLRTTVTGTGGAAHSFGTEVYAQISIWKVAS